MKTTIELPDEIFQQAQRQAARRGVDVNQFIATTVTKIIQAGTPPAPMNGGHRVEFPIIKRKAGAPMITKEMVDRAEEQMLKEEAEYYKFAGLDPEILRPSG